MTKLSPLILAFIVALGMISAVTLTVVSTVAQRVQVFSRDNHWTSSCALAPNHRVMGDPINDPKPNNK